jgi:hypothetical protein
VARVAAGRLRVGFTPGSDNGDPITLFTAECTSANGGVPNSVSSIVGSPVVVTGLTVGKSYSCTVAEANGRGTGSRSARTAVLVA